MIRKVLFRLVAIVIAIAATLLVVEAVLQGASLIVKRADRGTGTAPIDGEFRIACIGESTTYGLWPSQLENLLNEGLPDQKFRVINRGDVGIRTDGVAARIEGWIDEDRPHLVITMLGINDEGNVLVYPRGGRRGWLMDHSKTTRFLALLWRSAFEIGAPVPVRDDGPRGDDHLDDETRSKIDALERLRPDATARFRYSEMIEIHHELIDTDPGTPFYHLSYLRKIVLEHDHQDGLDEFFQNECGVVESELDDEERSAAIAIWTDRTGDRFAALRIATSIARWADDYETEEGLLEKAIVDPELTGFAWLRMAEFASRARRPELIRQSLINADGALPDDYQWSAVLGDVSFTLEVWDLAVNYLERALALRPDLLAGHELFFLGQLANACEQSGDTSRAAAYRAQRDELELGRFREFTRVYYQRVVDLVREREIPIIAMQYPLLSVESLRKLLDYRDDVTYLENRINFEEALLEAGYRDLFQDTFAGAFGHLSPRGNLLVAENVADTIARMSPELMPGGFAYRPPADESP